MVRCIAHCLTDEDLSGWVYGATCLEQLSSISAFFSTVPQHAAHGFAKGTAEDTDEIAVACCTLHAKIIVVHLDLAPARAHTNTHHILLLLRVIHIVFMARNGKYRFDI